MSSDMKKTPLWETFMIVDMFVLSAKIRKIMSELGIPRHFNGLHIPRHFSKTNLALDDSFTASLSEPSSEFYLVLKPVQRYGVHSSRKVRKFGQTGELGKF